MADDSRDASGTLKGSGENLRATTNINDRVLEQLAALVTRRVLRNMRKITVMSDAVATWETARQSRALWGQRTLPKFFPQGSASAKQRPDLNRDLLAYALEQCEVDGLLVEFGVFSGMSITWIHELSGQRVFGFDSFEGLPERWIWFERGSFDRAERGLPQVPEGVTLVKGWFADTLAAFGREHPGPIRFAHVDCDLYSSTRDVFEMLGDKMVPGTVILFNEFWNFPTWQEHEYRAFHEFLQRSRLSYDVIALEDDGLEVAVKLRR